MRSTRWCAASLPVAGGFKRATGSGSGEKDSASLRNRASTSSATMWLRWGDFDSRSWCQRRKAARSCSCRLGSGSATISPSMSRATGSSCSRHCRKGGERYLEPMVQRILVIVDHPVWRHAPEKKQPSDQEESGYCRQRGNGPCHVPRS